MFEISKISSQNNFVSKLANITIVFTSLLAISFGLGVIIVNSYYLKYGCFDIGLFRVRYILSGIFFLIYASLIVGIGWFTGDLFNRIIYWNFKRVKMCGGWERLKKEIF